MYAIHFLGGSCENQDSAWLHTYMYVLYLSIINHVCIMYHVHMYITEWRKEQYYGYIGYLRSWKNPPGYSSFLLNAAAARLCAAEGFLNIVSVQICMYVVCTYFRNAHIKYVTYNQYIHICMKMKDED